MTSQLKLRFLCLLLAGAFSSLAAQTSQSVSVFMPLVIGTGIDDRDNAFFYMLIYHELEAQGYIRMGRSGSTSDFSLVGAISPLGMDATSSFYEYRFDLYLQNSRTGQIESEQRYRYFNLNNADIAIKMMLDNVYAIIQPVPQPVQDEPLPQPVQPAPQPVQDEPLSQPVQPAPQIVQPVMPAPQIVQPVMPVPQPVFPVQQPVQQASPQPIDLAQQPVQEPVQPVQPVPQPVQPVQPVPQPVQPVTPVFKGDWRDRWLFFSLSAFWNPKVYFGETPAFNLTNPGAGFYPEIQFLDSVALETGLELTPEWIKVTEGDEFRDLMLQVPVMLKIVLKPSGHFLLEPYGGISFNFSLFGLIRPSPISLVAGYQHGVKAGPGALFFDFRFSMDMGNSSLVKNPDITYQRYGFSFSVGYKFGVLPK